MRAERIEMAGADNMSLIAGVQQRQLPAFEQLYLRYHVRVAHFLRRFTGCHETIEEIINDSFMVVWAGAKNFRSRSQVSTWVFGIAYRTALKALRRRRNVCYLSELSDDHEFSTDPTADTERKDWLDYALGRLSVDQRVALTLAYQQGFSMYEIADITASPVGTVKSRMFLARAKIRETIDR